MSSSSSSNEASCVAHIQRVMVREFQDYCQTLNQAAIHRDHIDEQLTELIRSTIDDLRQRRHHIEQSLHKKCFHVWSSLYYLSPLGRLFHPSKHKLAWRVIDEAYHQAKRPATTSV